MYCEKCGKPLDPHARFCESCGTPAPEANQAASPPVPPADLQQSAAWSPTASTPPGQGTEFQLSKSNESLPEHRDALDLYAGFWRRALAYFIDFFVLLVPSVLLFAAYGNAIGEGKHGIVGTAWLLLILLYWFYFAFCESSRWQATLGKRVLGLRVTDLCGNRIGFGKATGRFFGKLISGAILDIGYMLAGWTARKQALHDMMAGTTVTRRDGLARLRPNEDGARPAAGGMPGWVIALIILGLFSILGGALFTLALNRSEAEVADASSPAASSQDSGGNSDAANQQPAAQTETPSQSPIDVELKEGQKYYGGTRAVPYKQLIVISKVTKVTIDKVVVNRGNCGKNTSTEQQAYDFALALGSIESGGSTNTKMPVTLGFGDRMPMYISCDPIEADVETDQGTWTFTWPTSQ